MNCLVNVLILCGIGPSKSLTSAGLMRDAALNYDFTSYLPMPLVLFSWVLRCSSVAKDLPSSQVSVLLFQLQTLRGRPSLKWARFGLLLNKDCACPQRKNDCRSYWKTRRS